MGNKSIRNTVSVLLIMFMTASLFALPVLHKNSVDAATMKLNKKKVTMTVGKTVKLKVKNKGNKKVKWKSSKKSVVTVSKSGKLKAKKKGKATITAKVGSKKLKCKVTVKDPAKGDIKNPKLATEGVTVTTRYGKLYFKASIYKNTDAVAKLKAVDKWDTYDQKEYDSYIGSNDFILTLYSVKAVSGYSGSNKLSGMDIINSYRVYNPSGKTVIKYPTRYGGSTSTYVSNTSLYLNGGQSGNMQIGFYIPKTTKSFMTPIMNKKGKDYWVSYHF